MPKASLCIYSIALNEEKHVQRWFDASHDADHHLILDTGSTDRTVEIAKDLGIDVYEARFDPWRFDDARNASMALIPHDIEYVLQCDMDETLNDGWREAWDEAPTALRYGYWLENGVGNGWDRVRRQNLNARYGFRWRFPIHEIIDGPVATAHIDNLIITHRPDPGKSRAHYLDLLAVATKEAPDDARMAYYYGRELASHGTYGEARQELARFLALPTANWPPERAEACIHMSTMVYDNQKEHWLMKAAAEAPMRREPWVMLARLYLAQQKIAEAQAMIAVAHTRTDQTIYTTQASAWGREFEELKEQIEDAASRLLGDSVRETQKRDC